MPTNRHRSSCTTASSKRLACWPIAEGSNISTSTCQNTTMLFITAMPNTNRTYHGLAIIQSFAGAAGTRAIVPLNCRNEEKTADLSQGKMASNSS